MTDELERAVRKLLVSGHLKQTDDGRLLATRIAEDELAKSQINCTKMDLHADGGQMFSHKVDTKDLEKVLGGSLYDQIMDESKPLDAPVASRFK